MTGIECALFGTLTKDADARTGKPAHPPIGLDATAAFQGELPGMSSPVPDEEDGRRPAR
jgi:hypothetical protein